MSRPHSHSRISVYVTNVKPLSVTGVLLTYESTAGRWIIIEDSNDNSQESRTGVNACSISTKLYRLRTPLGAYSSNYENAAGYIDLLI